MRRFLAIIFFAVLAASPVFAGWSRAKLYGADVRALVVDPKHPDTVYLGTSEGDVYASKDGAKSWFNPRRGVPFPGYVVDNLLVDGKGRLWAACWGLWGGGVIAVSEDGGATWSRRDDGLRDFSVRAIAIDPRDADIAVAGGLTGIYRTRDAGRTWEKISAQENVESVAIDPRTADRIYVGTWRQAFRTEDGGKTWSLVNQGMVLDTDVFSINIDERNPDTVWLSTCGWVYSSFDRGDNWTRYKDGFNNRRIHSMTLDPADEKCVYAGSVAGLYRTRDKGKSWSLISDESMVINSVGLHPKRPQRIIVGTEGDGVYVSYDDGHSFTRSSNGLYNVRVASIVADSAVRDRLYASVYFGGSASGFYRSADGGESWEKLNRTKLPEMLSFIVQPESDARLVAGTEKGFFWSADGVEWTQAEPTFTTVRVEKILPYNRQRLFAATSEGVYTSNDSGRSWHQLANLTERVLDISIGHLGAKKAVYALTGSGLAVFDGTSWSRVANAPERGRTIAIRNDGDLEMIVIAGMQGVRAGHVDFRKQWHGADAPAMTYASVYQTYGVENRSVVLASREKTELLISDTDKPEWRPMALPARSLDVMTIAADPFNARDLFVATGGQGILIYRGVDRVAAAPSTGGSSAAYSAGGSK